MIAMLVIRGTSLHRGRCWSLPWTGGIPSRALQRPDLNNLFTLEKLTVSTLKPLDRDDVIRHCKRPSVCTGGSPHRACASGTDGEQAIYNCAARETRLG
jgi:hypothetical protein